MKWSRYAAFAIGILTGTVFLFYLEMPPNRPDTWEAMTLLSGPVTLVVASVVGLKFEKLAGWWLLAGALVTAVLLCIQLVPWHPGLAALLIVPAIFCMPMLFSGLLWLSHARAQHPNGMNLPMMP